MKSLLVCNVLLPLAGSCIDVEANCICPLVRAPLATTPKTDFEYMQQEYCPVVPGRLFVERICLFDFAVEQPKAANPDIVQFPDGYEFQPVGSSLLPPSHCSKPGFSN